MGKETHISWAHHTWNPWIGCTKVSPGCDHCYMFTAQRRFGRNPEVVMATKTWNDPLRWDSQAFKRGQRRRVFTCSWSDFFHPDADQWRADAWTTFKMTRMLDYLILTKRPGRIPYCLPVDWEDGDTYPNVWFGVSAESKDYLWRIDMLKKTSAPVLFISFEPLLEDLGDLDLSGIDWVIVGGESGSGYRPMDHAWVRRIRDACDRSFVRFYFKQSAALKSEQGTLLMEEDGSRHEWREFPDG